MLPINNDEACCVSVKKSKILSKYYADLNIFSYPGKCEMAADIMLWKESTTEALPNMNIFCDLFL